MSEMKKSYLRKICKSFKNYNNQLHIKQNSLKLSSKEKF